VKRSQHNLDGERRIDQSSASWQRFVGGQGKLPTGGHGIGRPNEHWSW
jgi:hypothetical protein